MSDELGVDFHNCVSAAYDVVLRRIASAGGDLERVKVIAVTKGFGRQAALQAMECGVFGVGENYANELLAKATQSDESVSIQWHFLGQIQRNKVRSLAPVVSLWQCVDRPEEGEAIAQVDPSASVLVEVNISGLAGRPGVMPEDATRLVRDLQSVGLSVKGAMGVAPRSSREQVRLSFAQLRNLVVELGLEEASMGMSDDLELAVAEGSTMVRVGRALFGNRPIVHA